MSNNYDDTGGVRSYDKIVRERLLRLEQVLDEIERRGTYADVPVGLKRELVSSIVSCHRVIAVMGSSNALDDSDIPDITPIRERLNRTAKVKTSSNRRGHDYTHETRPAVDGLDLRYLETLAREIEATANKLGHWASSPDTTEHDEVDHGDLAHLLQQRGQDEALEKVPGGDT